VSTDLIDGGMSPEQGQDRGESSEEDPLEMVAGGVVTVVTLAVAFGLLAAGFQFFWVAFVVGFGGGMPLAIGLTRWYRSRTEPAREGELSRGDDKEALAQLRERYARGELTDEEFEQRVSRLLETESVTDARDYAARARETDDRESDAGTGADEPERA
jgi:uncharacterized membrane protein